MEALAEAGVLIADASIGALSHVRVGRLAAGEELVQEERLGAGSVISGNIGFNREGSVEVVLRGRGIIRWVLGELFLVDLVHGVQVDVRGVQPVISGQEGEDVRLVEAGAHRVGRLSGPGVGLGGVVVVDLAGHVTVDLVITVRGLGDDLVGRKAEAGICIGGDARQGALGGVDVEVVIGATIGHDELVHQNKVGAIPEDSRVVAAIAGRGGGEDQLDKVRVVVVTIVPIVLLDVVEDVKVRSAKARLQQLHLVAIQAAEGDDGVAGDGLRGEGGGDAGADVGEVVHRLALLPVGPHGGDQSLAVGRGDGRALAVQVDLDLGLLQSAGVLRELNAVDGARHRHGVRGQGDVRGALGKFPEGRGVTDGAGPIGVVHGGGPGRADGQRVVVLSKGHKAGEGSSGDDLVGQGLQGGRNGCAVGTVGDGLSDPVLPVHVEEADGEVAGARVHHAISEVGGGSGSQDTKVPGGVLDGGGVIIVQRIDAVLAFALGAVRPVKALVALASHGGVLVPQLVDVVIVRGGELSDGLAHAVAGAHIGVSGAGGALAGRAVVPGEALALARVTVARALVGALHVVMGRVGHLAEIGVAALGELLGSAVGVVERVLSDGQIGAGDISAHVQISLGGVDVGEAELADALGAVVGLPVAVANAHIIGGALAVAIATIGALSRSHGHQSSDHSGGNNFLHHCLK
mmetsp:Transcript_31584/g.68881  ORF Transcript_31584/g.68881 Transcript_31584/m.68881 type:complete len:689 (-) Transcript_31584:42-2108(-)